MDQESDAVLDVIYERKRQIYKEGWTEQHDDAHESGELAGAGASYATNATAVLALNCNNIPNPTLWPGSLNWWKPTTPRRDLVKAAALIIAEIEKLDRAADYSK